MVLTPVDTNRELLYVWNIYRMLYLTWLIVVKVQSSPFVDKLYLAIWIPSGIHLSWWYDSNFDEVGDYLMISVDIIGNISEKEEMVSGDFYKVLIFWFTSQDRHAITNLTEIACYSWTKPSLCCYSERFSVRLIPSSTSGIATFTDLRKSTKLKWHT